MNWFFTYQFEILYISGALFSLCAMLSQTEEGFFTGPLAFLQPTNSEVVTEEKFFEEFESDFSQQIFSMQQNPSETETFDDSINIIDERNLKVGE